jgi:hypothetical protein
LVLIGRESPRGLIPLSHRSQCFLLHLPPQQVLQIQFNQFQKMSDNLSPLELLPSEVRLILYGLLLNDNDNKTLEIRNQRPIDYQERSSVFRTSYNIIEHDLYRRSRPTTYCTTTNIGKPGLIWKLCTLAFLCPKLIPLQTCTLLLCESIVESITKLHTSSTVHTPLVSEETWRLLYHSLGI